MAFSFGFSHSERKRTVKTVATDEFEREYRKFIEEQKNKKQECEVAESQTVQVSEETLAAVNAIIETTEAAEREQVEKTSKKKKKKYVEETVEL